MYIHTYSKILINYCFLIFGLRLMAVSMNLFALHSLSLPLYSSMLFESELSSVSAPFQYCLLTFNIFCFFFILLTKLHWWKLTCKVDSPVCIKQDWNPMIHSGSLQITFFLTSPQWLLFGLRFNFSPFWTLCERPRSVA